MNLAAPSGPAQIPTDTSPWNTVRCLYRRVCELRAAGQEREAAALESAGLATALVAARQSNEQTDEATLFAAENERVTNARLLAGLLAPMLASRLPAAGRPSSGASSPAPVDHVPARASSPPAVADMIDEMLAQAGARPPC